MLDQNVAEAARELFPVPRTDEAIGEFVEVRGCGAAATIGQDAVMLIFFEGSMNALHGLHEGLREAHLPFNYPPFDHVQDDAGQPPFVVEVQVGENADAELVGDKAVAAVQQIIDPMQSRWVNSQAHIKDDDD